MVNTVKKELTTVQTEFVNAWLFNGENPEETRKALRKADRRYCHVMLRVPKVKAEIARRKGELAVWIAKQDSLAGVSKEMKAELLWEVAKAGAERGFDKDGNAIMVNPASTISAIRELNLMVGAHAPTVVERKVEIVNRTEIEIIDNIQSLQAEVNELLELEAEQDKADVLEGQLISENEGG